MHTEEGHYEELTGGGAVTLSNQELTDWDLRGVPVNEALAFCYLLHTFITLKQFQATCYENKLSSLRCPSIYLKPMGHDAIMNVAWQLCDLEHREIHFCIETGPVSV